MLPTWPTMVPPRATKELWTKPKTWSTHKSGWKGSTTVTKRVICQNSCNGTKNFRKKCPMWLDSHHRPSKYLQHSHNPGTEPKVINTQHISGSTTRMTRTLGIDKHYRVVTWRLWLVSLTRISNKPFHSKTMWHCYHKTRPWSKSPLQAILCTTQCHPVCLNSNHKLGIEDTLQVLIQTPMPQLLDDLVEKGVIWRF